MPGRAEAPWRRETRSLGQPYAIVRGRRSKSEHRMWHCCVVCLAARSHARAGRRDRGSGMRRGPFPLIAWRVANDRPFPE